MEKLDKSLSTLVEKLQGAGFEQAPEVIAGAVRAIYYDGMLQLGATILFTISFLCLLALLLTGIFSKRLADSQNDAPVIFIGAFGMALSIVGIIVTCTADNP